MTVEEVGAAPGASRPETSSPTPPPEKPPPYCMNATEDEARYHAWLLARGEPIHTSVSRPSQETPRHPAIRRRFGRQPRPTGRPAPLASAVTRQPTFSVVPAGGRPGNLARSVASVAAQDSPSWQLLVITAGPEADAALAPLQDDPRLRIVAAPADGGTATAVNAALGAATGAYVVFLAVGDELHPQALGRVGEAIRQHPDLDVVYTDEDTVDAEGLRSRPLFKPDWSPDFLLSADYVGGALVVRRRLLADAGGWRSGANGAEQYDLVLRLAEATGAIGHVPEVLYHRRALPGQEAAAGPLPTAPEAARGVLEEALSRRGIVGEVVPHRTVAAAYHVMRRPQSRRLVSVVIPFRDEPAMTAACYRAFVTKAGYDDFELLLVDNDSALPETRALLGELARDHRVRLLEAPGPFDWVAINNEAARHAGGELLLFLNNDVLARSEGFLAQMVAHAERPEVGAVGARLLYPDGTVQHAGVLVGTGFGSTHVQQGIGAAQPGYLALATLTRDVSAVTGACLMTPRTVFESVGGFDARFPVAFNDIDYCLQLRRRGLLVVYTPLAELIHHESKSRGNSEDPTEAAYFRKRWRTVMLAGDPYYNRSLGRFDNSCRLPVEGDEERWESFLSMLGDSSTS